MYSGGGWLGGGGGGFGFVGWNYSEVESGAGCGWLEERADGCGKETKLLILASPSAACVSHALP